MAANTTRYKLLKPTVSGDSDVWGGYTNTDWDSLDVLLSPITTAGSANVYTLTTGQSLTAYADGQSFWIKASFANTGAATLNVDGIGAKNLRKLIAGTLTALASGDIASGDYLRVSYNSGSDVIVVLTSTNSSADLDPTLAALSLLAWSSLTPLIQFTAADTVSLTSNPKVTTLELGDTTDTTLSRSAAGVLAVEGVDQVGVSTAQTISGTKTFTGGITKSAAAGSAAQIVYGTSGASRWVTGRNSTAESGANAGSDFAIASFDDSAVFIRNDLIITRSTGLWVIGGSMQARIALSTETTGTLTTASANKKILASGGITLPASVFSAQDVIVVDGNGTARTITRGVGLTMYVNGANSATASLTANGVMSVHYRDATTCILTGNVS